MGQGSHKCGKRCIIDQIDVIHHFARQPLEAHKSTVDVTIPLYQGNTILC